MEKPNSANHSSKADECHDVVQSLDSSTLVLSGTACLGRLKARREGGDELLSAIQDALPQICKEASAGIEGLASIAISDVQRWRFHPAEQRL